MTQEIFAVIVGARGRMGTQLLKAGGAQHGLVITDAIVRPGSIDVGRTLGPDAVRATDELATAVGNADVVIDFSSPQACLDAAAIAARAGCAFVSGTTGLSAAQFDQLRGYTSDIPVLWASNFSVGVHVLERLVELAAQASGPGFDIEILEAHHQHKVDAPSGTALLLGEAAARGRDVNLQDHARFERHGHVGPRADNEIGFQSIRGGDIVGEHTVFLCGAGERLELSHRATDRAIFARGALRAARWIAHRPPGWYQMQDVLFGEK